MNSKVIAFLFVTVAVTYVSAAPATAIYKVGLWNSGVVRTGNTATLYYYHLGTANMHTIRTTFNGGTINCNEYRRITRGWTIIGFVNQCRLYSLNGIFELRAGRSPYLYNRNYLKVRVNNGRASPGFG